MNIWSQIASDAVWTPTVCASGRNSKRAQPNIRKTEFNEICLAVLSASKGMQRGLVKFWDLQVASRLPT